MKKALAWLGRTWSFFIWLVPVVVYAQTNQGIVPCGDNSFNPSDYNLATACNLCDFGRLIQNIINFLTVIAMPICALLFLYAGLKLLTAGGNTTKLTHAKKIIGRTIMGFIAVCCAWLVVQTVVVGLATNTSIFNGGSWNAVSCVDNGANDKANRPRDKTIQDLLNFGAGSNATNPNPIPPSGLPGTRGTTVCQTDNCSPSVINTAAEAAGLNLPSSQVNALSCIAQTELSGGSVGCSGTGPCGTFQISQTDWIASAPPGCQGLVNQNNASCNLQTALVMFQKRGYQPWTGNNNGVQWNPYASTCVNKFDPGTTIRT